MAINIPIRRSSVPRPFKQVYEEFDVDNARRLGSGGFAKVYLIRHKQTHKKFAAKYQKLPSSNNRMRDLVRQEANFLKELSEGKRVVDIHDYYEKGEHSLLVLEYLGHGHLFQKVAPNSYNLNEEVCMKFVREIIKALNFVHERGIIHLDLKPQNIMMKGGDMDEYRIKLIDFGLAKYLDKTGHAKVSFCGTVGFMAPEIARCQTKGSDYASAASDMFSLGVVSFMLVSGGYEPFWDGSDIRAIRNTLKKEVSFDADAFKNVSREAKDFIQKLLVKEPRQRMTAAEAQGHRWVRKDFDVHDGPKYKVQTVKMRRYNARYRWKKAIKEVRMMIQVKDSFFPTSYKSF